MKSYKNLASRNAGKELVEVSVVVPQGDQGMRLDRFIQRHIPRLSRTRVQEIITRGVHDQQGKSGKPAQRVRIGDVFTWQREIDAEELQPIEIPVVFDDGQLLVLNKPGDIVVHPTARVWRNTVTAWLNDHHPGAKIAHRLDKETSGVLICGYGRSAAWLKERFRFSEARKTYLAIVKGQPSFEELRCDLAMMLDDRSPLGVKMRIDEQGLPSVTHFRVLERLHDHALLECRPETGRQHQIRVHLWALGHPILGDKLYGVSESIFKESADRGSTPRVLAATGAHRHMLHAAELQVGDRIFSAPMHKDMAETLERSRGATRHSSAALARR